MAAKTHGRLGAQALAANTDTSVYSPGAGRKATCSVSICNRSSTDTTIRLAHIDGALGALATEDYLEYETPLPGGAVIERNGITVAAGHTIAARAAAATVSVVVWGVEEDA